MTQSRNSASPDFWEGLGRQLCRLVSLLSFSLLFSLLHFQETPEKTLQGMFSTVKLALCP